jgi:tetratricopeptide (TPR) repeat protein
VDARAARPPAAGHRRPGGAARRTRTRAPRCPAIIPRAGGAAAAGRARTFAERGRPLSQGARGRAAPEYAAALGDVYTRLGRTAEAGKQYALVEYIGRLSALNRTVYNRELALFYADHDRHLPQALELARKELEARRDIYSYDVLAWALYKNGRAREAQVAMTEALRLGTLDARLFFHAGMIHRALGEHDRAREALSRALALNPHFHLLHAQVARSVLAELQARR